jgi:hypothetical protein
MFTRFKFHSQNPIPKMKMQFEILIITHLSFCVRRVCFTLTHAPPSPYSQAKGAATFVVNTSLKTIPKMKKWVINIQVL